MIQYKPKRRPAIIEHPGNETIQPGELRVVIERPSAAEREMYAAKLAEYDKVVAAKDPDTGKIARDSTGSAIPLPLPVRYPMGVTINYLKNHIKDIQGFAEGDQPKQFSDTNAVEMIEQLLEDEYSFNEERDIPVRDANGNPTNQTEKKEAPISFLLHVIEKLHDPETYRDPLDGTNRSTTPAKSDSA